MGELCVSGKSLFDGYYNDKKTTDKVLKNGWFYTGDLAYTDKEGNYYIVSRKDNLIIRGGVNIYPEKIEALLEQDNNIKRAVVVSEKNNVTQDIIAKIVIQNTEDISVIQRRIFQKCKNSLGPVCMPDRIEIVDEIKKSITGKKIR